MQELKISDYTHTKEINIRFMDIDALQHVNNARYLNFLEEGRIAYSQDLLNTYFKISELNILVARIEIDFKRPIKFGELVKVYTKIAKIGTKSFQFDSLITTSQIDGSETICARGLQTLVAFDVKLGRSTELTEELKNSIKMVEPKL